MKNLILISIIFISVQMNAQFQFCQTTEDKYIGNQKSETNTINKIVPTLDISFEVSYEMFLDHNSNSLQVLDWVNNHFNAVAEIYAIEGILLNLVHVFIWSTPDTYDDISISQVLIQYGERLALDSVGLNGEAAILLTTNNLGGGLAYIDGLCTMPSNSTGPIGVVANLTTGFIDFPTYSYNVQVIAHELGHIIGSHHTHACVWGTNNNEALDNCYATEGLCAPGPTPIGGGTIMSFCHTTIQGINFLNGFGDEPGSLIYNKIVNSCIFNECLTVMPTAILEDDIIGAYGEVIINPTTITIDPSVINLIIKSDTSIELIDWEIPSYMNFSLIIDTCDN